MNIRLDEYPQLRQIAWNRTSSDCVSEQEALSLYERNWSLIDPEKIEEKEQALIDHLIKTVGNGVFHV